jgi:undecaprenyl-diphosphatase
MERVERGFLVAAALGALVFLAALASVLARAGLVAWDASVGAALAGIPAFPARVLDVLGSELVVAPVVLLGGAWLLWKRRPWGVAKLALLPLAGEVAVFAIKRLVGRERPPNPYDAGLGFPSGHATDAAIFACLAAWFALRRGSAAVAIVALGALWALAMAAARVALGVHYLSDVVAGLGLGAAIGGGGLVALTALQRKGYFSGSQRTL